jgi:hypothetical protein
MNKSPYRQLLETYLKNKEASGESLPSVNGRVNYRGISRETRIPRMQFGLGRELRLLVDASLEKLGVATGSAHEPPRRVLNFEDSTSSMTYGELKAGGRARLRPPDYSEKTAASYVSHLNAFMRHLGRSDNDSTNGDFGLGFEDALNTFLKATGRGNTAASALRFWARVHHELKRGGSLPSSFPAALTALVTESGRKLADIARAAGIKSSSNLEC